eukprot:sb/3463956/
MVIPPPRSMGDRDITLYLLLTSYKNLNNIFHSRSLSQRGQQKIRITVALVSALTAGLEYLEWSALGNVYQAILSNLVSWANSPPSGVELPPREDMELISVILEFLARFTKLHHSKHFDVHLVEQVHQLAMKVAGPIVTESLLDNVLRGIQFSPSLPSLRSLEVPSLPTIELHQYHTTSPSLDLHTLSPSGESLLQLHTCYSFIKTFINFLSVCYTISRDLGECVGTVLERCTGVITTPTTKLPPMISETITLTQHQFLLLSLRHLRSSKTTNFKLLPLGVGVMASLPPGYEYQQFQLVTGTLFDSHINPSSCGRHYVKTVEKQVTRERISKSQEHWTKEKERLYLGSITTPNSLNPNWILLPGLTLAEMVEADLQTYLGSFRDFLSAGVVDGIPVVEQLVHVMMSFLLPSRPFLNPQTAATLRDILDHFAALPTIDLSPSHLPGQASFYDFYNSFVEGFAAEGYCDPVYAGFLLLPTRCNYALSYRRLLWVERVETLRFLRSSSLPSTTR